jgi:hypothetical protein
LATNKSYFEKRIINWDPLNAKVIWLVFWDYITSMCNQKNYAIALTTSSPIAVPVLVFLHSID